MWLSVEYLLLLLMLSGLKSEQLNEHWQWQPAVRNKEILTLFDQGSGWRKECTGIIVLSLEQRCNLALLGFVTLKSAKESLSSGNA